MAAGKPVSDFRTPLGRARGLGSAKHGVGHFIGQRASAVALVLLVLWGVRSALKLAAPGGGYEGAVAWVQFTPNTIILILLLGVGAWHMQLGMRTVIEDYIGRPATRIACLLLNVFAAWGGFAVAAVAILKVAATNLGGA